MSNNFPDLVTSVPESVEGLPCFDGVKSALIANRVERLYQNNKFPFHRRIGDSIMGFSVIGPDEFIGKILELGVCDPFMKDFELEHSLAFKPFELSDPTLLHENLFDYFKPKSFTADLSLLKRCFASAINELKSTVGYKALKPLSIDSALKLMPEGTNSGLPFYTSKSWTREMELDYKSRAYSVVHGDPSVLYPYIMQHRLQPKQNGVSHRVVWNPDKSELIASKTLIAPILEMMQELACYRGYLGPHKVPDVMKPMFDEFDNFISLDFSGFDKCIQKDLMHLLRDSLKTLWDGEDAKIDALFHYYTDGPILFANEQKKIRLACGSHGVPSGVGATFLTSIINRACWLYVSTILGLNIQTFSGLKAGKWFHLANGDDTVIAIKGKQIKLESLIEAYASLGLVVNPDPRKSHITDGEKDPYVVFLSRYYSKDRPEGTFPLTKAALTLYFQERYKTKEMTLTSLGFPTDIEGGDQIVRQNDLIAVIQRLENCKYHQEFEKFVNYVQFTTPSYLDPILWDNKYTDRIAEVTRSGRISTLGGLRNFSTSRLIYETSKALGDNLFGLYNQHVGPGGDFKYLPETNIKTEKPKENKMTLSNETINQQPEQLLPSDSEAIFSLIEGSESLMASLSEEIAKCDEEIKEILNRKEALESTLSQAKLDHQYLLKSAPKSDLSDKPKTEVDELKAMVAMLQAQIAKLTSEPKPTEQQVDKVSDKTPKPVKVIQQTKQKPTPEVVVARPVQKMNDIVDDGTRLSKKRIELAAVMDQLEIEMMKPNRDNSEISRLSRERTSLSTSITQMEKAERSGKPKKSRKADKQATRKRQLNEVEEWLRKAERNNEVNTSYYQVQLAKAASLIAAIEASEASNS